MLSHSRRVLAVLLTASSLGATSAYAAQLLHEIPGGGAGSFEGPGPSATGTPGMVFGLLYEWRGFYGGSKVLGLDASLGIGDGSRPFASGSTGSLDFSAANSADFNALAAVLTGGGPGNLAFANLILLEGVLPNGQPFMGSVGQGPYAPPPLLIGAEVLSIRLQVNSVVASVRQDGRLGYSYQTDATWQVWGNPAAPVPEPSSALLLGSGCVALLALAAFRRALSPVHRPRA